MITARAFPLPLPVVLSATLLLASCTGEQQPAAHEAEAPPAASAYVLPPEPVVTYTTAAEGERVEHGEVILPVDEARKLLHAQHHADKVLETRRIAGLWKAPEMKNMSDFGLAQSDLDVIHPGPGEFVSVMEGQRHGYKNLTVGITWTAPGGAPPMHTHMGEESHVLLKGDVLYALGDSLFVMKGPYIVNIPPMVPHCFTNLGDSLAELVVIFPTNVWEYDVLDRFPFNSDKAKAMIAEYKAKKQAKDKK
jgi:quercetin dioxygenase-like cupin family protein